VGCCLWRMGISVSLVGFLTVHLIL
jgi:hypothetical protein